MPATPLLDKIRDPADLRHLMEAELPTLAQELRDAMIAIVAETGGHLGAGLGVVELTIALHYVFNTPDDRLIWDVGHQCYPHKMLTGRFDRLNSLRQLGGLSGFTKRSESPYDPFGAAHSSTSVSAALGMAVARDLAGASHRIIAVIGDGAMSAGLAFEAMNNAGAMKSQLLIILNDNDMSIDRPVGAMSSYFSNLLSSRSYLGLRNSAKHMMQAISPKIERVARNAEELARDLVTGRTIFADMGFYYIGPIDGHDLGHLVPVLQNLQQARHDGPILLHVVTRKGHGYPPAEQAEDKYHGVTSFNITTGIQQKSPSPAPSYTGVFAKMLCQLAREDERIIAITAAMQSGTGLTGFAKEFPDRCFDVGIAEQHAVTFAAGLASEGWKPFVAIYSTFLQRAYDQIIHDVMLQNLPVRFAIDRAGLVGADGATHAGIYDLAMLANLPNFVVMAPSDEYELACMTVTAGRYDLGPIALRYPRGAGVGVTWQQEAEALEIGRGRIVNRGSTIAILNLGTRLQAVLQAARQLEDHDRAPTVVDMRFAKPIDGALIEELAGSHQWLVTVEEAASGGFAAAVMQHLAEMGLSGSVGFLPLLIPDYPIEQASQAQQYHEAGLDGEHIARRIIEATTRKTMNHANQAGLKRPNHHPGYVPNQQEGQG
ncbi:MAG: 1-deoxy-D-xylulose-5-phosphate synthase [Pseudomonadota bacterium]